MTVNRRDHLNMHPGEALGEYWKRLLCGEVSGSVRGRAKSYGVGVSTVTQMDKEKGAVLAELQQMAGAAGVALDVSFIRVHAPEWKERATWRDGSASRPEGDGGDRRVIEGLLRSFALRFTDQARTQPEAMVEAFREFMEEPTGRKVDIRFIRDDDEEANSDF